VWRHDSIKAEGCGFERGSVGLDVFQEFEAEVVERKLGEGDAVPEVFDIEDFVLEAKELPVTVAEVFVDEFLDVRALENVVLEGGGDVHEGHAGFDAVLEVDVFVKVFGRPEVDELDGVTGTANVVNASEALDDSDRIPVDIVGCGLVLLLELRSDIFGWIEQGELIAHDFVVELIVGEESTAQIDVGIDRDRLLPLGKTAKLGDALLIVLLNVLAGASTENFVDGPLHAILLKLEESFPYLSLKKAGLAQ